MPYGATERAPHDNRAPPPRGAALNAPRIAIVVPDAADALAVRAQAAGMAVVSVSLLREDIDADVLICVSPETRKLVSRPTFLLIEGDLSDLCVDERQWLRLSAFDGFLVAAPGQMRTVLHLGIGLKLFTPEPEAAPGGASDVASLAAAAARLFSRWSSDRAARAAAHSDRRLDVIMRTGGRPTDVVLQAVRSIAAQSAGAIRLLVVRHGATDVAAIEAEINDRLLAVTVVDAPGANRSRALAAGLAQVTAPHFALLDDDDYLLEDHFLHLFEAGDRVPGGRALAYCDVLTQHSDGELSIWREGAARPPLGRIGDRITAHGFLASTSALKELRPDLWDNATAEDALAIASLLVYSTPIHASRPTCVYRQGLAGGSDYLRRRDRAADELMLALELAPVRTEIEQKFAGEADDPSTYLQPFFANARRMALLERLRAGEGAPRPGEALALRGDRPAVAVAADGGLLLTPIVPQFSAGGGTVEVNADGSVTVTPSEPHAYAARLDLPPMDQPPPEVLAVRVEPVTALYGLAFVGGDHRLIDEATIYPVAFAQEIQLPWPTEIVPAGLVVRLLENATAPGALVIRSLDLGYRKTAMSERAIRSPHLAEAPGGEGTSVLIGAASGSLEIDLGGDAWAYAFSLALPAEASGSVVKVELEAVGVSFFVGRVDDGWTMIGERLAVAPGPGVINLWMEPLSPPTGQRLVIQAGGMPNHRRVTLRSVKLYRQD